MKKNRHRFLLPLLNAALWVTGTLLGAEVAPSSNTPQLIMKPRNGYVGLELPFVLKSFAQVPTGLEARHLEPPLSITAGVIGPLNDGIAVPLYGWLRGNLSFLKFASFPIVGGSLGLLAEVSRWEIELGGQLEFQNTLSVEPLKSSPLAAFWYTALLKVRYPLPVVTPELGIRIIGVNANRIASFEGLDTTIAYGTSWEISPKVHLTLPEGVKLDAGIDLLSLGVAAIASKEFAFPIKSQTIFRYTAGLGVPIGEVELWVRAAFLDKVPDSMEHVYQAPFLVNEYWLAPQTLSIEVKWLL